MRDCSHDVNAASQQEKALCMKGFSQTTSLKQPQRKGSTARGLIAAIWVIAQGFTLTLPAMAVKPNEMSYSELLQKVNEGQISKVEIDPTQRTARVTLDNQKKGDPPKEVFLFEKYPELTKELQRNKVDYSVQPTADNSAVMGLLANLLLFFLLIGGLLLIIRRSSNAPGGPGQAMNFGKSRARFQMEAKTGVMFDDVAGIEEAKEELQEVVTFL
ncbi:MAG: ATP-dependent metallopeptidase FtsH/Yme1/Tma family protein, partial [Kovacikia sp.]